MIRAEGLVQCWKCNHVEYKERAWDRCSKCRGEVEVLYTVGADGMLYHVPLDEERYRKKERPGVVLKGEYKAPTRVFCRKCGRELEDAESVRVGLGPECRRKEHP